MAGSARSAHWRTLTGPSFFSFDPVSIRVSVSAYRKTKHCLPRRLPACLLVAETSTGNFRPYTQQSTKAAVSDGRPTWILCSVAPFGPMRLPTFFASTSTNTFVST
jgi:hypothetical protein